MIRRALAQTFWSLRIAYLDHLSERIALLDPANPEAALVMLELDHAHTRLRDAIAA